MAFDFKKEYRQFYLPPRRPEIVRVPQMRFAAVRGFVAGASAPQVLLCDPWADGTDFDAETAMPLDDFLVAWNNTALCMRKRDPDGALPGCPARTSAWLRRVPKVAPDLFAMYIGSTQHVLPDDFCAALPAPAAPAAPEEAPAEDAAPTDAPDAPDSPADDVKGGLLTTHFEFKYLHDLHGNGAAVTVPNWHRAKSTPGGKSCRNTSHEICV